MHNTYITRSSCYLVDNSLSVCFNLCKEFIICPRDLEYARVPSQRCGV